MELRTCGGRVVGLVVEEFISKESDRSNSIGAEVRKEC